MTVEQQLKQAIERGEVIRVSYAGGSQPGAVRDIAPISISGDKVRARCYMSNAVKLFVIDKIIIHGTHDKSEEKEWSPLEAAKQRYESLSAFLQENQLKLIDKGWVIEYGDEFISLHRIGKRGKPLKNPTVLINFKERKMDTVYDFETNDFVEQKMPLSRPWIVMGDGLPTKNFVHLDKAAIAFLEFAEKLAPGKAPEQ